MASIQGIYLALFGRPADPAGLAYWTAQSKNGADLSKVIDTMTKLPEATARFAGQTDTALVTSIYQALFDRAPDAAGLAFFTQQLASGKQTIGSLAINILDGATGADLTLIGNRVKAADVFTASLDTPAEIAAYSGTTAADFGRTFVKTVTGDAATIPTSTQVQTSINTSLPGASGGQTPGEGQTPGGGGGGGGGSVTPNLASYDATTKTVTLAANADATVTASGRDLLFTANNFNTFAATGTNVEKIVLGNGAVLHTLGNTLLGTATRLTEISGGGKLDVQGVTFSNANGALPAKASFEPSPSLDEIYSKIAAGTVFSVNGNEADTIKGIWDVLDDNYVQYNNITVNTAFVNLGIRYVEYLEKGGVPFTDLVGKADDAAGRNQSMHDNLLGNLNNDPLESRFDDATTAAFKARIPDQYENRPIYDGYKGSVGGANHDGARAFDYAKGWVRPDYLDKVMSGKIDASAIKDTKELFVGSGNTVTGFNIVRHEGEGIELALKAKIREGADYAATESNNGIIKYQVDAGAAAAAHWGTPAKWSFDFSVATGLNTQNASKTLADYKFKAFVDVDPSAATKYLVIDMQNQGPGNTPWALVDANGTIITDGRAGGFGDDDGQVNTKISQNSVNFGFGFIKNAIDNDPNADGIQAYTFGKGTFDIEFKAFDATGVKELASNHIQVIVDGIIPA